MAIDVTGIDLVKFAQAVYELSSPQGLGFLHFTPEPLSEEEAKQLIHVDDKYCVLKMDYVRGRACKMYVHVKDNRWTIPDTWYDHTDRIFKQLLDAFQIKRKEDVKHGIACGCMDCESTRCGM